jgi:hypothetical protein
MNTFLLLTWVAVIAISFFVAIRVLKKLELYE